MISTKLGNVASSPVREILALTARPGVISFAGGLPAPELFDVDGLRAAFDRALSARTLQYSVTEGNPELRSWIGQRIDADPGQILITTGSQQALTLVATTLVDPGDVVLVESPSYLAALQCFALAGARLIEVPGDDDGPDPAALEALVREHNPKLLYLIPTFQNPTGRTIPLARRQALAAVVERTGLTVLEDDPYGELRYEGDREPTVASLVPNNTILLGSFSKVMAPGLRLGYARAPRSLYPSMVIAKQAADLHTSTIDQAAAAAYLAAADLDAHIATVRAFYRDRRDAMLDELAESMPNGASWNRPTGGMFVWLRVPGVDATELLPRALAHDVAFVPGAPFFVANPDPAAMRLSFTTHGPDEIRDGLRRLGKALSAGPLTQ